jgi:predicted ATPase
VNACPTVTLLVTSRAPLRVARERVFSVPMLTYPETARGVTPDGLSRYSAVCLFVDRARSRDPEFELNASNAPAVAELCAYLGGLPLAIEIVASRASVLSPQAMLARLRGLLDGQGARRDAPKRHQTLRATIGWSYRLLTEPEQALFARLAVFAESFTTQAAEDVTAGVGLDSDHVVDALSRLVDHGLIHPVKSQADRRFAMLEPVHEYASSVLESDTATRERTLARHAEYYVRLGVAARDGLKTSEKLEWVPRLDAEQANLLAVLRRSSSPEEIDAELGLATALESYWPARVLAAGDWIAWALPQSTHNDSVRADALLILADREAEQGKQALAIQTVDRCLQLCESLRDPRLTAIALSQRAWLGHAAGDHSHAAEMAKLALQQSAGIDRWTRAFVLHRCAGATQDYHEAQRLCDQSISLFRSLGDHIWRSAACNTLTWLALLQGDLELARERLNEAATTQLAFPDHGLEPVLAGNLGLLELLQGRDLDAHQQFARSVSLATRSGLRSVAREALNGLAAVAANAADTERAARLAAAAEALHDGPRDLGDELIRRRFLTSIPPGALAGRAIATGERLTETEIDQVIAEVSASVDSQPTELSQERAPPNAIPSSRVC